LWLLVQYLLFGNLFSSGFVKNGFGGGLSGGSSLLSWCFRHLESAQKLEVRHYKLQGGDAELAFG